MEFREYFHDRIVISKTTFVKHEKIKGDKD
jgi:hypothetical protein